MAGRERWCAHATWPWRTMSADAGAASMAVEWRSCGGRWLGPAGETGRGCTRRGGQPADWACRPRWQLQAGMRRGEGGCRGGPGAPAHAPGEQPSDTPGHLARCRFCVQCKGATSRWLVEALMQSCLCNVTLCVEGNSLCGSLCACCHVVPDVARPLFCALSCHSLSAGCHEARDLSRTAGIQSR